MIINIVEYKPIASEQLFEKIIRENPSLCDRNFTLQIEIGEPHFVDDDDTSYSWPVNAIMWPAGEDRPVDAEEVWLVNGYAEQDAENIADQLCALFGVKRIVE